VEELIQRLREAYKFLQQKKIKEFRRRVSFGDLSKYPPAEPGALVLEPLEAACPCRFSSPALLR
jgi:hypothetical protein